MSDSHQLPPSVCTQQWQVVELVDWFMEKYLIIEVEFQVLAIGALIHELSEELVYKQELNLRLCQNEITARIRRRYAAILLQVVKPVEKLSFVCILVYFSFLEVNHLVSQSFQQTLNQH